MARQADIRVTAPLAVTLGEPAGIGTEIILKAWLARQTQALPPFYAVGDPGWLEHCARRLGLSVPVRICEPREAAAHFASALPVYALPDNVTGSPGSLDSRNAKPVCDSIITAVDHVFSDHASGIVTAPINKKALYDSGFSFPGHTEFLGALAQERTGAPSVPIMMLAGPELRTIPVTIHIPLSDVPRRLTSEAILTAGRIADRDLKSRFGISAPRLAVSGLNPHAGEEGAMGLEDREIVAPAVEQLLREGIQASGPHPADTMFHASARSRYDVALCMYHDQALIPAKTLAFEDAVNVTLGLPFIRTSPDHGTALEIAGQGVANAASMIAAIAMAGQMAERAAVRQSGFSE